MKLLPISSSETLRKCREFGKDSIFIASFPKSGTTWVQACVFHLIAKELSLGKNKAEQGLSLDHISHYAPFYEIDRTWTEKEEPELVAAYNEAHATIKRRMFNTHLLPEMLPSSARAIYVVRNARDVAFSFYHHLSNQDEESGGSQWSSFEEFVDDFLNGELPYDKWVDHVATWLSFMEKEVGREKVLLLSYEDLVSDLNACLHKISNHLNLALTKEDIDVVAPSLTFESMSADRSKYEPISVKWKQGYQFLRKGIVNDSYSAFFAPSDGIGDSAGLTVLGKKYQAAMDEELAKVEATCSASVVERVASLTR